VFRINISTKSLAHLKNVTFLPVLTGIQNSEFLWKKQHSYAPQRTVCRTIFFTPYLVVDFNSVCHLYLVPTALLPSQLSVSILTMHCYLHRSDSIWNHTSLQFNRHRWSFQDVTWTGCEVDHRVGHRVDHTVDHRVDHTLDHRVDHTLGHTVDNTLDHTVDNTVNHTFDHTVDNTLDHTVDNTLDHTVDNKLDHTVDNTLDHTVDNTVDNTLDHTVGNTVDHTVDNTLGHTLDNTVNDTFDHNCPFSGEVKNKNECSSTSIFHFGLHSHKRHNTVHLTFHYFIILSYSIQQTPQYAVSSCPFQLPLSEALFSPPPITAVHTTHSAVLLSRKLKRCVCEWRHGVLLP